MRLHPNKIPAAFALGLGLLACHHRAWAVPQTLAGAAPDSATAQALAVGQDQPKLQLGLGFPDLRLRVNLSGPVDAEAKVALSQGMQAYGARLYCRVFQGGPLGLRLGAEAGYLSFHDVDTLSGNGGYGELFLGAEYRFLKRWNALVDYGLAKIDVNAQGQSLAQQQWVLNTALYYTLF
jgi:hypothetical protein